jgi:hypothetical protein
VSRQDKRFSYRIKHISVQTQLYLDSKICVSKKSDMSWPVSSSCRWKRVVLFDTLNLLSKYSCVLNYYECIQINNYKSNQHDPNINVNLLFLMNTTCFGRCFRPSLGARVCIYGIWYHSPKSLPAGAMDELKPSFSSSMTPAGSELGECYQML